MAKTAAKTLAQGKELIATICFWEAGNEIATEKIFVYVFHALTE